MTSNIIKDTESGTNIWDKIMLVRSVHNGNILLTNGKHEGSNFCGTCILEGKNSATKLGEFSKNWDKRCFTPITSPITIEFNP